MTDELKAAPWTPEHALGTIEAFIEGGDELGIVTKYEALNAVGTLRVALAVNGERDELHTAISNLLDEVDALKAQLGVETEEREEIEKRILTDFYNEVCEDAESMIARTGMVSGAHWTAMKRVFARKTKRGNEEVTE